MKRELKPGTIGTTGHSIEDCRAYPDEKGIETTDQPICSITNEKHCRAYPDEKGIETHSISWPGVLHLPWIAEPIPMKRELKHISRAYIRELGDLIAEPIPMKRELKRTDSIRDSSRS